MIKKTVVVGMSGGVDSSVSALLLKQQGFNVIGMFMKNWDEDEEGVCPATLDFEDVVNVCKKIDIPYYAVNFVKEYRAQVFDQFLKECLEGKTPNPDILCNREIKFQVFLEKALELGADYLATGHYCQNLAVGEQRCLIKGLDPQKDQSYFLHAIKENVLQKVLFPIGHLEKSEVRRLALDAGLVTASKKDSTGICFIGKRNFKDFLSQHLHCQPGHFETLDGKVIGRHEGIAYYTIGQRKGLSIGGAGEAWFVVGKDIQRNVVFVEQGALHPALFADELIAKDLTFIGNSPSHFPYACSTKIRYRQKDQPAIIESIKDGKALIKFLVPQRAITPGQSVVFYQDSICLGGGVIESAGLSYHYRKKTLPNGLTTD
ncbi:tRNA-specific 2-thiouridylase MnmA [Chlamydiales bacterium STE3]|nr:tRNA-specific 2-thiouridylase MnmA [Chlamydiales bacterium STE3]